MQIIDFVIWSLFRGRATVSSRPRHILCHGLQRAAGANASGEGGPETTSLPGIVRYHPNACLGQLKSSPWSDVLPLLGEDGEVIFTSLFLDCGIFTRLPSGKDNYFQLSGIPISEMTPLCSSRKSCNTSAPATQKQNVQPSSIRFVRNRILYAKPSLKCNGQVRVGLSHAHVLQRFPDAGRQDHTLHVLKYIFPRQYNLHNVFTSRVDSSETVQQLKDYTFREQEISGQHKGLSRFVPRRLRGKAFQLVQKLQRRQNGCSYGQLLRHHCPIAPAPVESPVAFFSKQSRHATTSPEVLVTQAPLSGSSKARDVGSDERETEASFLPYATSVARVSAFCQSVIAHLLPKDAFGTGPEGRHNHEMIMRKVDEFIRMRRFESMTLHSVVHNVRLRPIDWLSLPGQSMQKMSKFDYSKRLELLYEFVYYVFDSLLIPLIRNNFYVTESSTHRNRLFYFRHDVWRKLSAPSFATLKSSMYAPVNPSQVRQTLRSRTLGYSHVRLLPKSEGSRPITNLRRRQPRLISGKRVLGSSINAQLGALFSILNFERGRDPSRLGSALLSVGDLHDRLVQFKRTVPTGSRLYFTKVDIQSCFDSIPQKLLLDIARCLFGEPSYRTTKYTEVKFVDDGVRADKGRRLRRRYIGAARVADGTAVFSESVGADLALRKNKVVFADTGNNRISPRTSLLQLLQEHVGNNIVKIGKKHFRQTSGIPQGSVLSSLLCSYFYGAFERTELSFLDPQSSLLLRLIDDFLLVTTNEGIARQFLDVMVRGNERYGIIVNAEKSLANFDVLIQGRRVPRVHGSKFFPYCGMGIEMRTLELSKDREKKDAYVSNALTVETCSNPGTTLKRKILRSLKLQMHSMLLDMSLNDRQNVISTLLGNFAEAAMKMHRYVASLPRHRRPSEGLLMALVNDLVSTATKICRVNNSNGSQISKSQVGWIAASSFEQVLLRKQSQYRELLAWLKSLREGNAPRMNLGPSTLEQLLLENEKAFRGYVY